MLLEGEINKFIKFMFLNTKNKNRQSRFEGEYIWRTTGPRSEQDK